MCVIFSGCTNAVFHSIRKEVALEDAQIKGFINSIVRFTDSSSKEWLYLQNGRIFYKQVSDDDDVSKLTKNMYGKAWQEDQSAPAALKYDYFSSEFSGWNIYKIASDQNHVYALAFQPTYNDTYSRNEPRRVKLFCTSSVGGPWKEVSEVNRAIEKYIEKLNPDLFMVDSSIHLFCTNSPKKENRAAFIRIGGGTPSRSTNSSHEIYERPNYEQHYGNREYGNCGILKLSGAATTVEEGDTIPAGTYGATYRTLSAYNMNGNIHFLNFLAAETDETKSSEAKYLYYGNGSSLKSVSAAAFSSATAKTVYLKDTDGNYTKTLSSVNEFDAYINGMAIDSDGNKLSEPAGIENTSGAAANIISMAVTKDSVILGTLEYGAYRVLKDSATGKPATATTDFTTNASSIMYSPYIVRVLFCTDPSIEETGEGSSLYSSMQFRYTESTASAEYGNVGLWSYYSTRANWNRE